MSTFLRRTLYLSRLIKCKSLHKTAHPASLKMSLQIFRLCKLGKIRAYLPLQCLLRAHWYLAVICFPGKISQTSDLLLNGRRHSVEFLFDQSPPNPMSLFYSPKSSKQLSSWSQSIGNFENRCGASSKW